MSSNIWFQKSDIKLQNSIILDELHGYILPHASTKYTGDILSHTLRFKPKKANFVKKIVIIYYPAFEKENIEIGTKKYYHEFYVPWQTMVLALSFWKIVLSNITFIPINVRETTNKSLLKGINFDDDETFFIVSSDFSHYLPFKEAIVKENTAAHALMYKNTDPKFMNNVVDDPRSFSYLFTMLPTKSITLQWVDRSRSPGLEAVGYLSFLIMKQHEVKDSKLPDGIFVTCYDTEMRDRECLGTWFSDKNKYSKKEEKKLINRVIRLGQTESRLTGGENTKPLIKYYTVSYLYKGQTNNSDKFIRGWHTVLGNATYLSDVFLENTFNNGKWINFDIDKEWQSDYKNGMNEFDMSETLEQLNLKSHLDPNTPQHELEFYKTFVKNVVKNGNKIQTKENKNGNGNGNKNGKRKTYKIR
jgi:hypothetical protein